ncbi:outer membrane beta-barrel protein [Legionella pneumophila serogroup 10]
MTGKIKIAVLGLGISLGCFAGEMGAIQKSGFYLQAMLDYNWFHYNHAYTASFFGPQNISALDASIDNQWGYGFGLGYRFNDYVRTAITVQARPDVNFAVTDDGPETATGHFDNYTYMLNGYLSSPNFSVMNFNPYIMAGVGVAHNKTTNIYWPAAAQTEFADKATKFAWQFGIGSLYALSDSLLIDINYNFISIGEVRNSGQYNAIAANNTPASGAPTKFTNVYSNQAEIGIHYQFNT